MKPAHLPLLLSFLAIAACSGGGADFVPPPASSDLNITPANAQTVSKAAFESANQSADISDLLGNTGFISSSNGGQFKSQAPTSISLRNFVQAIPFGPTVLPCLVSGSITLSGDLADPFTLTAGDTINVDADNCDDGVGEITDGLLAFTVDAFTGDFLAGAYDLTMSMSLTDFQVRTSADVLTSNGDVTVSLDTTLAPAVSASVTGMSLTTDSNTSSDTLSNFSTTQTLDAGVQPSPYTLLSSGALDSSRLAGLVNYSTPVPFGGFDVDYPNTGELLVTADNSSARLIAIDNVNVRIEIDTDGNGSIDETIVTTWADLTS